MNKDTSAFFSVSLPRALLQQLDEMTGEKGCDTCSKMRPNLILEIS
jgi:metal-responsive CopG/Arc/MetJ family transcriptional regulator